MTPIEEAILLAYEIHKDEKYGNKPYISHLQDVYNLAVRYQLYEYAQVAAWLHDSIESNPDMVEKVSTSVSADALKIILLVTDNQGANRRDRKKGVLARTATDSMAVALKLCDLVSNVCRSMEVNDRKKLEMYIKESKDVSDHFMPVVLSSYDWRLEELMSLYNRFIKTAKDRI